MRPRGLRLLGGKRGAGGVQVFGVDVRGNPLHLRQRRLQGAIGGLGGLAVGSLFQRVDLLFGQDALAQQAHLHLGQWVAQCVGLALGGGAVELVVVRERVGVGPDAMAVDKRRPLARAAMRRGGLKGAQAGLRVGAVHLGKVEVGEVGHQPRDVAAGRVHLDRRR